MKTALIFGYGGFVGPYLAKEFIDDDYKVVGCDINVPLNLDDDSSFEKCNILVFDEVLKIINSVKPSVIINLAAISSVGQSWKIPQTTVSVNVVGALNILEASKMLDIKPKVLFVGSSEEYKTSEKAINEECELDANNPYGISKLMQERFAELYREQYNMKIYCVRPFNHTGIGQRDTFVLPSFCKQIAEIEKSGKPGTIYVGNLDIKRDFSDVRDIVKAYKMIVDSENDRIVYNVGFGKAYSLKDLLNYIISLSHQEIEVSINQDRARSVDNPIILCDHSLITKNLSWNPKYDILETIKEMYNFYLKSN